MPLAESAESTESRRPPDIEIEPLGPNLALLVLLTPELRRLVTSSKKPTDGTPALKRPKAPLKQVLVEARAGKGE